MTKKLLIKQVNVVNIKFSLMISFLAGTGLVALLYIAPVRQSETISRNNSPETPYPSEDGGSSTQRFLDLPGAKDSLVFRTPGIFNRSGDVNETLSFNTLTGHSYAIARKTGRTYMSEKYRNNGEEQGFFLPDYISVNQPLTKDISFKTQYERTDRNTAFSKTGIELNDSFISASIMSITPANQLQRDFTFRKDEKVYYNTPVSYEATVSPYRNLNLTTSVIDANSTKSEIDAAKVGMAFAMDKITFNLKYAYSSSSQGNLTDYRKSFFNLLQNEKGVNDTTTLGFTVFLDSQKKYSVYVGNQYYNTMFYQPGYSSRVLLPSVMATFKGKATESVKYFFNFQNQPYRQSSYLNYGLFKLPVNSQSAIDFATTLGMEQSF